MPSNIKQLHWSQRVALFRHNLHAASRSGDFGFFKSLQVMGFVEGANHAAALSEGMNDDADVFLAAVDNLNSTLAYVHQDAYENVYNYLRNTMREDDGRVDQSKLFVEVNLQKNKADMAIDKTTSSAIALIDQQAPHLQELAAHVWMSGATIVADCIQVTLNEMDKIEDHINDCIRLESSWGAVKAACACAVTGIRCIFSLMDTSSACRPQEAPASPSSRPTSIASASGAMFRRLSNAFTASGPSSRRNSVVSGSSNPLYGQGGSAPSSNSLPCSSAPVYRTPNYIRSNVNAGCPTSMPGWLFDQHKLAAIPPTPVALDDEAPDPFDTPLMPALPERMGMPGLAIKAGKVPQAVA